MEKISFTPLQCPTGEEKLEICHLQLAYERRWNKGNRIFDLLKAEKVLEFIKYFIFYTHPKRRQVNCEAELSIDTRTLRLNRNVVEKLDEDELMYILLHGLIHLKVNDVNHGSSFMKELGKHFKLEKIREIEIRIIKKLILEEKDTLNWIE